MSKRVNVFMFLSLFVVIACEKSESLSDVICEKMFSCCPKGIEIFESESDCKLFYGLMEMSEDEIKSNPKVVYNKSADEECDKLVKKVYRETACDESMESHPDYQMAQEQCEKKYTGTVDEGGFCAEDVECKDGLFCNTPEDSNTGVCEKDDWDDYDDESTFADECINRSKGEECDSGSYFMSQCADGLYCSDEDVCTEKKASGETCESVDECIGTCSNEVCVDLKKAGEECSFDSECEENLYCNDSSQCAKKKGLGESCESFSECEDDLWCEDGTCADWELTF